VPDNKADAVHCDSLKFLKKRCVQKALTKKTALASRQCIPSDGDEKTRKTRIFLLFRVLTAGRLDA